MLGVTPSCPFSRLVLKLLEGNTSLLVVTDVLLPRLPSTLRRVALSGVVYHILGKYPMLCPLSQGMRTNVGPQGSVNYPICEEGDGVIQ